VNKSKAANEKNAVGRPLVQLSDLPPNWRDIMHAVYGEGGSDAEVKCALAIAPARAMSNDLFNALQDREPDFSEAVKEGRQLAEAWWAAAGKKGMRRQIDPTATVVVVRVFAGNEAFGRTGATAML
jgi:hypothetical protein